MGTSRGGLTARDDAALRALARQQDGVVTWAQVRSCGLGEPDVRRELRAGRWERVRRGAYLLDAEREQARGFVVVARAVSLTTPSAVIAGPAAARLWGIHGVQQDAVDVVLPPRAPLHARTDMRPHTWRLSPGDVTSLRGMRVTTPARTLLDVVPRLDRPTALAVLDSALRQTSLRPEDLRRLAGRASGRPGAAHVSDLWSAADARAESVLESRVRLRCLDSGVPPDDLQVEIRDGDGFLLARADLVYRRRSAGRQGGLLLVEADGAGVHARPDALFADRARANGLVVQGHDVLRVTWPDTLDPHTIARAVRAAL